MKPQSARMRDAKCAAQFAHGGSGGGGAIIIFFSSPPHNEPEKVCESHQGALQFHRPSSAQSSHSLELQRRCPRPICFLCGEDRQEDTQEIFFLFLAISHRTQDGVTHFLCSYISH